MIFPWLTDGELIFGLALEGYFKDKVSFCKMKLLFFVTDLERAENLRLTMVLTLSERSCFKNPEHKIT